MGERVGEFHVHVVAEAEMVGHFAIAFIIIYRAVARREPQHRGHERHDRSGGSLKTEDICR